MDLIMWSKANQERDYNENRRWRFPEFQANRTIRILFSNKNWSPAFENKNYEKYGMVRVRRYEKEDKHLSCLIEFEDKAVVDKILSDGHIYINDHRIKVQAMPVLDSEAAHMVNDLIMQPFDDEGPLSNNGNTFNLIGLNDDCLRFIFRKMHLCTLWSLANTCVRFNELAKETFRLKYRQKQIRFCDVFTVYPVPLLQIDAFLKMFGTSIQNIFIAPHEFNHFDEYRLNDVLLLIGRHCSNLKFLDMRKLAVDYTIWNEFLPLFSQLESLNVKFADTDLKLVQPTSLPKLTSFKISTKHFEHMRSFLLNNWPLEELSMNGYTQGQCRLTQADWSNFFQLICEHCATVKKLSIRPTISYSDDNNFSTNLMRLSDLTHLRKLRLIFNLSRVRPLLEKMLQNGIQLEYLDIARADILADGIDIISQFKTISTLKLSWHCRYTLNDVITLAERLPSLSKLGFHTYDLGFDSTVDNIDVMMPIVSNGKRLSHIIVKFTCERAQYTDKKYDELLAIVEKRVIPLKLRVTFESTWYGPHTVAHFSEMKSNPDLLIIEELF